MIVPARAWIAAYDRTWLRGDVIAGITLAAYLLPSAIGDASLAGLPPQAGLYACLFGGLVFWLFCSSRHTAIAVTSAISLLIGASLAEISGGDPARHAALASLTALLVAVLAFTAYAFRAGSIVNFFSETVLVGFKGGLALYLASSQLPKLFGFKGTQGDFFDRSVYFLGHLGDTHQTSLLVGTVALAGLVMGKLYLKNRPVAFFAVILGIAATRVFDLGARGVALLGEVPQGLPPLGLPDVSRADLNTLFPIAAACFVLGAVETFAIGRMFGQKHGYALDANRELLAMGMGNLFSGLGRGFPVSGGMSQSLVNESAGAQSPKSGLVAALITLVVVLFAAGMLRNLPQPVLAAIVLAAIMGLVDLKALRHIWHFSRGEFICAIAAVAGVLTSGPVNGVLIGALLSIVLLVRQVARPRVTELGRVPGTTFFSDLEQSPDNLTTPGVLVIRPESGIVYFNVTHVRERVMQLLGTRTESVRLVVMFLGAVPRIDLAGAEFLAELNGTLEARGITMRLAEAHGEVRKALDRSGFARMYGVLESGQTVEVVLTSWQKDQGDRHNHVAESA
jgi:high affinity sulfate transporter 1